MEQFRKEAEKHRKGILKLLADPSRTVTGIAKEYGISTQRIYQIAKFEGIDVWKYKRKARKS